MPSIFEDFYGHRSAASAPAIAAAAVGVVTVGTISGTTAAGAAPTITAVSANDTRGVFTLTPVTGGGAQAAGATVNVTFSQSYPVAPAVIQVIVTNQAGPASAAAYATTITAAGFQISTSLLVTANLYTVTYNVIT